MSHKLHLAFAFVLAAASVALPDSLWTKSGERYVGEVTEEGDNYRVRTTLVPGGILVPKSSVIERLPAPDVMMREIDIEIEEARKLSAEMRPGMPDASEFVRIVNERLDWCEARIVKLLGAYPAEEPGCAKLRTRVAEIRKYTSTAAGSGAGTAKKAGPPRIVPAEEAPGTWVPPTAADVPEPQILLRPPAGTSPEAAAAAANAMRRRLSGFGDKGIDVTVIDRAGSPILRFSSADGLTRQVRERIRWFGTFRGRSFEGRIEAFPEPEVMALHERPDPDSVEKVNAPPGTKWYLFNAASVILLANTPVLRDADFRNPVVDPVSSCITFALTPETCKALRAAVSLPGHNLETTDWALVLDGHAFRLKGAVLAFEADGRDWVKGKPRVTVGPGGKFKTDDGHWEARKGEAVWAKTGLVESAWKQIRAALDNPMEITLARDE